MSGESAPAPSASTSLPPRLDQFVGREDKIAELLALLDPGESPPQRVLVGAVAGVPGIGKTALAVEAAHRATAERGWFPGGVLFLDMRGHDPGGQVTGCATRQQAEAALARLVDLLADLGLEPKAAKTRIVHLDVGGEGLDFLGFHHRLVRSQGRVGQRGITFLARWPSRRAMQHARQRLRELTLRKRVLLPVEVIVAEVNRFLRGWTAYFRYGNSARHFQKIRKHAAERLAGFIAKRHHRPRAFGRYVFGFASPDHLGLIALHGIVIAPRPMRDWRATRATPNADSERRR